jgi:hypothetical protein
MKKQLAIRALDMVVRLRNRQNDVKDLGRENRSTCFERNNSMDRDWDLIRRSPYRPAPSETPHHRPHRKLHSIACPQWTKPLAPGAATTGAGRPSGLCTKTDRDFRFRQRDISGSMSYVEKAKHL